jgi:hypothetical protein
MIVNDGTKKAYVGTAASLSALGMTITSQAHFNYIHTMYYMFKTIN